MVPTAYPAIIERAGERYSVFFPDLPGCTSAGTTVEDATLKAQAILWEHLLECSITGEVAAAPSPLGSLRINRQANEVDRVLIAVRA